MRLINGMPATASQLRDMLCRGDCETQLPSRHLQHLLSVVYDAAVHMQLISSCRDPIDKARLMSITNTVLMAFLGAGRMGRDSLPDRDVTDACRIQFGLHASGLPVTCPCGRPASTSHSLSCPSAAGSQITIRHDHVVRFLARYMRDAGGVPELERVIGTERRDRADISMRDTNGGLENMDVVITNPLATTYAEAAAGKRGATAERAEATKRASYRLRGLGDVTPLAIEAYGGLGRPMRDLSKRLAIAYAGRRPGMRVQVAADLFRRGLSSVLMRGNVACLREALRRGMMARARATAAPQVPGRRHRARQARF